MPEELLPPDLQFSVLCDDVRVEKNGKFILLGLFEAIRATRFPVRHPALFVVNRWCNGHGEFREKTRLVSSTNEQIVESQENVFHLKSTVGVYTVVSRFASIGFKEPGTYWVEVMLGAQLQLRYPLTLVQINPGQAKQPEP